MLNVHWSGNIFEQGSGMANVLTFCLISTFYNDNCSNRKIFEIIIKLSSPEIINFIWSVCIDSVEKYRRIIKNMEIKILFNAYQNKLIQCTSTYKLQKKLL